MNNKYHTVRGKGSEDGMYVHHEDGYTRANMPIWHATAGQKDGLLHPDLYFVITPHGCVLARKGKAHLTLITGKDMMQYWQRIPFLFKHEEDIQNEAERFAKLIDGVNE